MKIQGKNMLSVSPRFCFVFDLCLALFHFWFILSLLSLDMNCIRKSNYSHNKYIFVPFGNFFTIFFREIRKAKGGVTKRNLKNVGTWFLKIIRLFILQNNVQHLVLHVCYNVLTYYQSWCIWDLKALISKNRSKTMESWIFS